MLWAIFHKEDNLRWRPRLLSVCRETIQESGTEISPILMDLFR